MPSIGFFLMALVMFMAFVSGVNGYEEPRWFKMLFGFIFLAGAAMFFAGVAAWMWEVMP